MQTARTLCRSREPWISLQQIGEGKTISERKTVHSTAFQFVTLQLTILLQDKVCLGMFLVPFLRRNSDHINRNRDSYNRRKYKQKNLVPKMYFSSD
jgi:hypothetical protein